MSAAKQNIHFLAHGQSALATIAEQILSTTIESPDLTRVHIITKDSRLTPALRGALLDAATQKQQQALLGPYFYTVDQWLQDFIPDDLNICDDQIRLLILVEALLAAPGLLKQANPWSLADNLLQLFDELTLNQIEIASDLDTFNQQLSEWYKTGQHHFSGLQQEAELIHQLWYAWHEQLQAQGYCDSVSAHILALNNSLNFDFKNHQVHLIGFEPDYSTQQIWLTQLLQHERVHLWIQGTPHSPEGDCRNEDRLYRLQKQLDVSVSSQANNDEYQRAITTIFSRQPQITERAEQFAKQHSHSPLKDRIEIYDAHNAEQQIHAVDTQIRRWLLDGKRQIAIVTENRLLARRLRALLERADIQLQDAAGWTLATTRAAASIESLLLCIEEDFDKDALLDLLKSGLLFPDQDQQLLKKLVYRLEHDIIQNEQVTNNLSRYQHAITSRKERLQDIWQFSPEQLLKLLDDIQQATQPLRDLNRKKIEISELITALLTTLEQLGMSANLQDDDAGQIILQLLDEMVLAANTQPLVANWTHFRAWLGRNFESRYFQPQSTDNTVRLFNLSQTGFQQFDGLIIAGLEQDAMPGTAPVSQFFNNQVRSQLGLPGHDHFREQRLRQFTDLLYSSESILLTYRSEQDGEPVIVSPWLAAIQQFHQIAYGNKPEETLRATELEQRIVQQSTQVIRCDTTSLPKKQAQARPVLTDKLVPHTFSASSYQQLMNCPYQFFAAQCLKLRPPEEIQLALSQREYGERVHLCLQAFHSDVSYLPGPFQESITFEQRQAAIDMMQEIAAAVFEYDMKENYIHKGWYHQWLNVIPTYIDWHISSKQNARIIHTEEKLERTLPTGITLKGRLDRIDCEDAHYEVIDYKTGQLPSKKDVLAGEQVQLPFYALLTEPDKMPINSAGYLALGKDKNFQAMFPLNTDELSVLAGNVLDRLQEMVSSLEQGQELPAWENSKVCNHCDMISLCRCGTWQD